MRHMRKTGLSIVAAMSLAGCGGGGGAGGSTTLLEAASNLVIGTFAGGNFTTNALAVSYRNLTSFDIYDTAAQTLRSSALYSIQNIVWNFNGGSRTYNSFSLASARVDYAHAAGLSGAGQTIAIIDDGFSTSHASIAGRVLADSRSGDPLAHGTAVASVAAGRSADMTGVAFRSDLLLGTYETAETRTAATDAARRLGAVVQNNSWGFVNRPATMGSFQETFVIGRDSTYLTALRNYVQNGVVVFAADNRRDATTSGLMEALPLFAPELEAGWLAVINGVPRFDNDRILSVERISAPCLEAARWCLVADGAWIAAAPGASNTATGLWAGTSFAAPVVSGAIAILAEAFPNLTPHDLRARLLASADNRFAGFTSQGRLEVIPGSGFFHDYSTEWGHGFIDLRAALLPIGTPVARMADGSVINATQPLILGGAASGDAVARSLSKVPLLVTDALGGDFSMPGTALAATARAAPVADRLWPAMLGNTPQSGLMRAYGGAGTILRHGATEVSLLGPETAGQSNVDVPPLAAAIGQRIDTAEGEVFIGLNIGRDDGTLMPGIGGGATLMAALDLGFTRPLGQGAYIEVAGTLGLSRGDDLDGLMDQSDMIFNALRIEAGQRDVFRTGDRLSFGLSMPVAVTAGESRIALPVSRSAGAIEHRSIGIDYAPQDREIDLSITYGMPIGRDGEVFLGAIHAFNHGHVAGAQDTAAILGIRMRF